jgi:hypothetical protein
MNDTPHTILEYAQYLTTLNLRLFPIITNGNLPAIKKYPQLASQDLTAHLKYWNKRTPYNIGVAAGLNPLTGRSLVILDFDSPEHKNSPGLETFKTIKEYLPPTFTVQSCNNGLHLYYWTDEETIERLDIRTRTSVKHDGIPLTGLPGVDIRANGGYVVGPGSWRQQKTYRILKSLPIADLPLHLFETIKRRKDESTGRSPERGNTGTAVANVTQSLITDTTPSKYSEFPDQIPAGGRDDTVFRYACSWRERGYALEHCKILMRELHSRLEPVASDPISLEDCTAKLERAFREYKPGGNPDDNWTQLVQPATRAVVQVPSHEVDSMQKALSRFVFIESRNRVADLNKHPNYAVLTLDEFKNSYKNVWVNKKQLPTVWLVHKGRQTVRDTIYWPSAERITQHKKESFFNTYTGSDLLVPKEVSHDKIAVFLNHIKYLFPDEEPRNRLLDWFATTVQKPDKRIPWSPLLVSTPGVGKGWLYKALRKILGSHNCSLITLTDLEKSSQYNEYLSGTTLVCLDDIKKAMNADIAQLLSSQMTESYLNINHKYGGKGMEYVFSNFIAFSNYFDAVNIEDNDRRFWVYQIEAAQREAQYYTDLFEWLETDGPAHLELYMRQRDISQFKYAEPPPMTKAKKAMVDASMSNIEQLISDSIDDHVGPFQGDIVDSQVVESFVKQQLDIDRLSRADAYQVRRVYTKFTNSLAQDRYRVNLSETNTNKRYRLRSVRNTDTWLQANPSAIAEEFKRVWLFSMGRQAPSVQEVRGEDNT